MRQTQIFTVDRRSWFVAESIEDIQEIYHTGCKHFYMALTETNNSGSSQSTLVFLIKNVVLLKDLR